MLRDLEKKPGDEGYPPLRKGEIDPNDSVFLVLLWEDVNDRASFQIGFVGLGKGEAEGAARRYADEGSKVTRFVYATVVEMQTGQLHPKGERHGGEYRRPKPPEEQTPASRLAELELEIQRIRSSMGQTQTYGPDAGKPGEPVIDPRALVDGRQMADALAASGASSVPGGNPAS